MAGSGVPCVYATDPILGGIQIGIFKNILRHLLHLCFFVFLSAGAAAGRFLAAGFDLALAWLEDSFL